MQVEQTQSEQVFAELSKSHAEVLLDLEGAKDLKASAVIDLTSEEPSEVPPILLAEMRGAVKSINDVLGPQHFKSDWRVKWEKKSGALKESTAKAKAKAWKNKGRQQHADAAKKRIIVEAAKADPNWKIGNKFPRQKGAAMTDFAM